MTLKELTAVLINNNNSMINTKQELYYNIFSTQIDKNNNRKSSNCNIQQLDFLNKN